MTVKIDEQQLIDVCKEAKSMREAAIKLGLAFNTFRRKAKKLGCYKTNQSGKGIEKEFSWKIPLNEIFEGKHPNFSRCALKSRLLITGLKENKCEICGITKWNGNSLVIHLDHINGINNDNRLENLRMLCPNCHSQTSTYTGKNKNKTESVSDEDIIKSLKQSFL